MLENFVNISIGDRLRDNSIGYIGGIVRPIKLNIGGKIKTVPGWPKYERDPGQCKPGEVVPMIPNESEGAVMYFEPVSDNYGVRLSAGQMVTSTLRAVYWYDSRRYAEQTKEQVIRNLMFIVNGTVGDLVNLQYKVLQVRTGEILPGGAGLFSQYSYDEAEAQYLMPPFEAVAFNVYIKWILLNGACNSSSSFSRELVC